MDTVNLKILNPKALKLLKNLEDLELISINKKTESSLQNVLSKLRNTKNQKPSLKEITKEVEIVRAKRYAKQKSNN